MEEELTTLRADLARTCELLAGLTNALAAHVAVTRAMHDLLDAEGVLSRHQVRAQAQAYAARAGFGPEVTEAMTLMLAPAAEAGAPVGALH